MNRQYSPTVVNASLIIYCFTVDALWSPKTLNDFMEVVKTGFGDRENHRFSVVTASEAASLSVLTPLDSDAVEPIEVRL